MRLVYPLKSFAWSSQAKGYRFYPLRGLKMVSLAAQWFQVSFFVICGGIFNNRLVQ
jgi:hypothetical protein